MYSWADSDDDVDWGELSEMYWLAPLGHKPQDHLQFVFDNSRYKCFVYADGRVVGAGRAVADGRDVSYIADVAVHPDHQGQGLGQQIIQRLVDLSAGHKKIILYANPGTEGFYVRLGFYPMNTAMAIWHDQESAVASGLLRRP